MSGPFLILHKVRGEAAFDVAERLDGADEEIWIIPTSGHRAHPYWSCELLTSADQLLIGAGHGNHPWILFVEDLALPPLPDGLPDHYAINKEPAEPRKLGIIDLEELDL
jgi:hypothetical protein